MHVVLFLIKRRQLKSDVTKMSSDYQEYMLITFVVKVLTVIEHTRKRIPLLVGYDNVKIFANACF